MRDRQAAVQTPAVGQHQAVVELNRRRHVRPARQGIPDGRQLLGHARRAERDDLRVQEGGGDVEVEALVRAFEQHGIDGELDPLLSASPTLAFVTFVGDIVQHGDGQFRRAIPDAEGEYQLFDTREEWDIANRAVSILTDSGLPFGMVPGNHDYDNYSWRGYDGASEPLAGGRAWNFYFGPQSRHFTDKAWYGGALTNGLNSFQTFTAGGLSFLHLSLEMQPPQTALDWAQGVIDAHPDTPVIVTTHEWLRPDVQERSNGYGSYFAGADNLPPD